MKIPSMLIVIASASLALSCVSDRQADRGVEGTLRTTVTDRNVDIDVHHGIVTLEGKVHTEADRQRIENLVSNTAGVVAVKNKLKVILPTPGEYGAVPAAVPVQAAPPTAVVTEPPAVVAQSPAVITQPPAVVTVPPAVVAVPTPSAPMPPSILVPNTPRLKVQPVTAHDEITAGRIAEQLGDDAVALAELDNVTVTVNSGTAAMKGVVDSKFKHDALLASVQKAGGLTAIYDQLQVR